MDKSTKIQNGLPLAFELHRWVAQMSGSDEISCIKWHWSDSYEMTLDLRTLYAYGSHVDDLYWCKVWTQQRTQSVRWYWWTKFMVW